MGNVIDYIDWRGDLRFAQDKFNDVDALILSILSYLPMKGIVPDLDSKKKVSLKEAARLYFSKNPQHEEDPSHADITVSSSMDKGLIHLLKKTSRSKRFSDIQLTGYQEKIDAAKEQQFAAITCLLPHSKREKVIAFRGTDKSFIGWKEDFAMAYRDVIPAQESACNYLQRSVGFFSGKTTVCGHSKGGNLAVFAASCLKGLDRKRLKQVFNFDGPGFDFSIVNKSRFNNCRSITKNYTPEESIIGVLLEEVGKRIIIKSNARYLLQHNPVTWQIEGPNFLRGELSQTTKLLKENLESWLAGLSLEKRKSFTEALFEILGDSEDKTGDIKERLKDISKVIKNYANLDEEIKEMIAEVLASMTEKAKDALAETLKEKLP